MINEITFVVIITISKKKTMGDFFSTNYLVGTSALNQQHQGGPTHKNVQEAIDKLTMAQDDIGKRISYLQIKIDGLQKLAKIEMARGNKTKALLCLKRKKMLESNITQMEGMNFNIDQQIATIETMQLNTISFGALSESTSVLKGMTASMDVDNVADVMSDMKENIDTVDEIGSLISADYSGSSFMIDESQLEDELRDLITEDSMVTLNDLNVPTNPLVKPTTIIQVNSLSTTTTPHHVVSSLPLHNSPTSQIISNTSTQQHQRIRVDQSLESFGSEYF